MFFFILGERLDPTRIFQNGTHSTSSQMLHNLNTSTNSPFTPNINVISPNINVLDTPLIQYIPTMVSYSTYWWNTKICQVAKNQFFNLISKLLTGMQCFLTTWKISENSYKYPWLLYIYEWILKFVHVWSINISYCLKIVYWYKSYCIWSCCVYIHQFQLVDNLVTRSLSDNDDKVVSNLCLALI